MANSSVFDLHKTLAVDESIIGKQDFEFRPNSSCDLNAIGAISIDVYPSGDYFYIHETYLLFEGKVTDGGTELTVGKEVAFSNCGILLAFKQAEYKLNGMSIAQLYEPGLAYLIKVLCRQTTDANLYCNMNERDNAKTLTCASNSGFKVRQSFLVETPKPPGQFSVIVPLKLLFSFADDFQRILVNVRQTLILIRKDDSNALVRNNSSQATDCRIEFSKISMVQPLIRASEQSRIEILKLIKNRERFAIRFHSDHLESLNLNSTIDQTINLGIQTSRPRFLIFAMQTERIDSQKLNVSCFDHCNITNYYAQLNAARFPSFDYNLDFAGLRVVRAFNDFKNFYNSFFEIDSTVNRSSLSLIEWSSLYPLFIIDLSKQAVNLQDSCLSLSLRLFFKTAPAEKTILRVLIVSEKLVLMQSSGDSFNIVY